MTKIFTIKPEMCITGSDANLYRPFTINGSKVIKLNLNRLTDPERENIEMERFCSELSEYVGRPIQPSDLPSILKNRQIVVEG